MMSIQELRKHCEELGLNPPEAARLLSVSTRTVRRWLDGSQGITGPAELALRAWLRLHRSGLAWRPDGVALAANDEDMIARHREHAVELDALLARVKARGGPAAPWQVDLEQCRATLGKMQVSFYRLRNGGFSPQSYRRSDGVPPDLQRDWPLIEDAYACIARAFADRGQQRRTHFAFIGPCLDNGGLRFWDSTLSPPVVAVLACQALRAVLGPDRVISDKECQLLGMSNKELLTELAENRFAQDRYTTSKDFGIRVVEIEVRDLKGVLDQLSTTILDSPRPTWGG